MLNIKNISREYPTIEQNIHTVKIAKGLLEKYIEMAKEIEKETNDVKSGNHTVKFPGKNHFPTVEEMISHNVEKELRKYLPMLIFYRQSDIDDGSAEYEDFKNYIDNVFEKYLEPVENEVFEQIESLTKKKWKEMSLDKKVKIFKPLIDHYKDDEFGLFLSDLGWKKFMSLKGYTKKSFKQGYMPEENILALKEVWDACRK